MKCQFKILNHGPISVCSTWLDVKAQNNTLQKLAHEIIRDVARPTCALPLNLLRSMTHDIDLKVTQKGHDGTA